MGFAGLARGFFSVKTDFKMNRKVYFWKAVVTEIWIVIDHEGIEG